MLAGKSRAKKCHLQIFCLSPPPLSQALLGWWQHMHSKYKLCSKKKWLTGGHGEHGSGKDQPGLIAAAIRLTESRDLAHWRPNPA